MTHLKKLDDSPPIDLSGWNFGFDKMDPIIAEAVSEAIANTFAEEDFGGLEVSADTDDLSRIVLNVPFGKDEPVAFEFSVIDVILENIRWVVDPQVALKTKDKFVQLAALLHKVASPKEDIPRFDIDSVELPAFYRSSLNLDQLWNWDSHAPVDKICQALEADVAEAKAAIDNLREKKLTLETALTHYRALAAGQSPPDA